MRRESTRSPLSLVFLLLIVLTTGVNATYSGAYRLLQRGLPLCETRASVLRTNMTATESIYSVATGGCNVTSLVFAHNTTIWNGTQTFTCTDTTPNSSTTISFAKFSCHQKRRPELVQNVTRNHGRCYLEFGTPDQICVYEDTKSWDTLDWLIPAAILTSLFAIVICCCVHQRIKKAAKPRESYEPFDGGAF